MELERDSNNLKYDLQDVHKTSIERQSKIEYLETQLVQSEAETKRMRSEIQIKTQSIE